MIDLPRGLILLGDPVTHSLSPAMQTAALRDAHIDLTYVARATPSNQLESAVAGIRTNNLAGNVTIPHKLAMFALCDVTTPLAKRVGAVNTFWMDNGVLHGDNTDVGGFDLAARTLLQANPSNGSSRAYNVTVLGAGGASNAVLAALEHWDNTKVTLWNRTPDRAYALSQRFDTACVNLDIADAVHAADLVINATPHGLLDDNYTVDIALLPPYAAVYDLVYKADETAWVRAARHAGHRAADGLGMLVEQGALAFERWFGFPPNREIMWRAITHRSYPLMGRS